MRTALMGLAALAFVAGTASADTFGFTRITDNGNGDISDQLSVEVTDAGGGAVNFKFVNAVGVDSNVTEIYIDDGSPAESLMSGFILDQSGSTFAYGSANPGDLPGGNGVDFNVSAGFLADSDLGAQGNDRDGLDAASDYVTIQATLKAGFSFADVIARLEAGDTRFGLHIRSIGDNGGSDSYVTPGDDEDPNPLIPAPMTALMGAAGLGVVASRRRR